MRSSFALSVGPIAALDNGPALPDEQESVALLVPGYTGSKEDFMPLLRPLASAGIRAIAIDQRGQYESAWAGDSAGYEIDRLDGQKRYEVWLDGSGTPVMFTTYNPNGTVTFTLNG